MCIALVLAETRSFSTPPDSEASRHIADQSIYWKHTDETLHRPLVRKQTNKPARVAVMLK